MTLPSRAHSQKTQKRFEEQKSQAMRPTGVWTIPPARGGLKESYLQHEVPGTAGFSLGGRRPCQGSLRCAMSRPLPWRARPPARPPCKPGRQGDSYVSSPYVARARDDNLLQLSFTFGGTELGSHRLFQHPKSTKLFASRTLRAWLEVEGQSMRATCGREQSTSPGQNGSVQRQQCKSPGIGRPKVELSPRPCWFWEHAVAVSHVCCSASVTWFPAAHCLIELDFCCKIFWKHFPGVVFSDLTFAAIGFGRDGTCFEYPHNPPFLIPSFN